MKRIASVLSAAMLMGFAGPVFSGQGAVTTPPGTKIEWPDYGSGKWPMFARNAWPVEIRIPVKNNKYIPGPARYDVMVGTISVFVDSLKNPALAVTEGDVFGKGPVIRMMEMAGVGMLARQVKVNGEWRDLPERASVLVDITEPGGVVFRSELKSLMIRVIDDEKEIIKLLIENNASSNLKK